MAQNRLTRGQGQIAGTALVADPSLGKYPVRRSIGMDQGGGPPFEAGTTAGTSIVSKRIAAVESGLATSNLTVMVNAPIIDDLAPPY